MRIREWVFPVLLWPALIINGAVQAEEVKANPDFFYFHQGETPDGWHWVLADPGNWWIPLEGNTGESAEGKLQMQPSDSPQFPGAVKLVWSKAEKWGSALITGRSVDLSAYEHVAEMALAIKLDTRTRNPVYIKMACGEGCEAQVPIHNHLKKAALNKWFALPIPLDCFTAQGADLKNITSPFSIGTDGSMVLHIAEISVSAMAEGDEGCTPNAVSMVE